ncbi:MAG TPA: BlaI/MecI/CopY family transcriptional regulator [Candidatus Acidoferrum sp.]|nr:BlaI/MecI/CopY family transcriptional regulator [Candidatus Acidoferrum sp.]
MAKARNDGQQAGVRHSILDLAPLELDCMNALWPLEEATVRQVQEALAPRRPRAYTTIMTILDRLAQKGVVGRRKVGRAYVYVANLRNGEAQEHAVAQVIDGFFGGSRDALAAHLSGKEIPESKSSMERVSSPSQSNEPATVRPSRRSIEPAPEPRALDSTLL